MNREEAKLKAAVFLDHLSIKGYEWEENAEDLEDQIENNRVAYKIKKIDRPLPEVMLVDYQKLSFNQGITFDKEAKNNLPELYKIVNDFNQVGIVRYAVYLDHPTAPDGLYLSALYWGGYDKSLFDYFLGHWEYGSLEIFRDNIDLLDSIPELIY